MSYEEDQARILSLIKSLEEGEVILGGESSEIEDEVEIVSYNSECEQSAEEKEDSSDEDIPLSQIPCSIYGKDGLTVWKTIQPPQNSRTQHGIIAAVSCLTFDRSLSGLVRNIPQDDNNALSESAMRISYKICHEIAKELKTFNEGNFIKRCLIILTDELCPQQVGELEAIRLSRRTVVRRLQITMKGLQDKEDNRRALTTELSHDMGEVVPSNIIQEEDINFITRPLFPQDLSTGHCNLYTYTSVYRHAYQTDYVRYTLRYLHCFRVVSCPHPSDSALNGILEPETPLAPPSKIGVR
ncbi:hypothetical protein ANN_13309 [Periplaneta americana]|uniref:Uncharacterized protein n=1 Tax=Periplaneta americana TaxID=6978 RepID=A0ABQ8TLM1_PERAM|nr:hypothetical protein ANN_13309 [Periplaneta americana]